MHVPLSFEASIQGQYSISMAEQTFDPWVTLSLEDLKTGSQVSLHIDPEYEFDYSPGADPARFILHVAGLSVSVNEETNHSLVYTSGKMLKIENDKMQMVMIYSMQGQLVRQMILRAGTNTLAMEVAPAFYIVRLTGPSGVVVRKVWIGL
jgi:hypothetical protein